jgi:hypothetical protein
MKKTIFCFCTLLCMLFVFQWLVFAQTDDKEQKTGLSSGAENSTADLNIPASVKEELVKNGIATVDGPLGSAKAGGYISEGQKGKVETAVTENIQKLVQEPEVIAILSDPVVREAIMRQDLETLKNNEKFLKFMANPVVKQITDDSLAAQEKGKTK